MLEISKRPQPLNPIRGLSAGKWGWMLGSKAVGDLPHPEGWGSSRIAVTAGSLGGLPAESGTGSVFAPLRRSTCG